MNARYGLCLLLSLALFACGEAAPTGQDLPSPAPEEGTSASPGSGGEAEGAIPAEGPGASPASALPADRRESLKRLAVASECMRRATLPAETVMTRMLALYDEEAIDLATYTREMGRLASDKTFQAEVQSGLASCPSQVADDAPVPEEPLAVDDLALAGDEVADDATVDGDPAEPTAGDKAPDALDAPAGLDGAEAPPGDSELAGDEGEDDGQAPEEDTGPDFGGTWTGAFRGSISGTLRIVIHGRSVRSATMVWGGRTVRLRGSLGRNGQLTLGGRINASDFLNLRGRIDRSGKRLTGTWSGVVDRKRVQGNATLTR